MLKSSVLTLCISCVFLTPVLAQALDCVRQEQECIKKCKEEKLKAEDKIDIRNAGEDVDEELQADVLLKLQKLEVKLKECEKSCADARRKCEGQ